MQISYNWCINSTVFSLLGIAYVDLNKEKAIEVWLFDIKSTPVLSIFFTKNFNIIINFFRQVTGNITGDDMDKFLPNPTLDESDEIKANVIFKKIIVDGDIIVQNNFNKANLNDTLQDLVYKVRF